MRSYLSILLTIALSFGCTSAKKDGIIKVLILSGRNNHEWQKTTPALVKIYDEYNFFRVTVTEKPDTLTYKEFVKYDVLLSNWNSWPDTSFRMSEQWDNDFVRYIESGGGAIFIHAGASSFYNWDAYHQIGIGRWGKETKHGSLTIGMLNGFTSDNPVTKGLNDFNLTDEIWEKTDICPGAKVLALITAISKEDGHSIIEPAVFVNNFGKGRSFFTMLGHNEPAFNNPGFKTLLLRASQWTAYHEVTIEPE
jgi:uncharacterized protein